MGRVTGRVTNAANFSTAGVVYASDRFDKSLSSSSFGLWTSSRARFFWRAFRERTVRPEADNHDGTGTSATLMPDE